MRAPGGILCLPSICYHPVMTQLLDQAVQSVRHLPPDTQNEIARVILRLAATDDDPVVILTQAETAAIARSNAAGDFATEEEVRAVWAKHGL